MPDVTSTEADGDFTAPSDRLFLPAEKRLNKLEEIQERHKKNLPSTMSLVMNSALKLFSLHLFQGFDIGDEGLK